MATLSLNLDTTAKTIDLMVDGERVEGFDCLSVFMRTPYDYYGAGVTPEPHFEICSIINENGKSAHTRIIASDKDGPTAAQVAVAKMFERK